MCAKMLLYFLVFWFMYIIFISKVYTAAIETADKSKNVTDNETGNFSSNIVVPAAKENGSTITNLSLSVHSPRISFDFKENVSFVTHQKHSSQTSNTAKLANITILNASSLVTTGKILKNNSLKVNISSVATESPEANISSVGKESPEVNISSVATESPNVNISYVAPHTSTQNSTTFQSIIHQKKKRHSKRFVKDTFDVTNLFLQRIALKYLQKASSLEQVNQTIRNDGLGQRQIRSIFRLAKFGTPSLLRCNQPESTIMVKCISNIARVTLASDNEDRFDARISLDKKKNRKFVLDGFKQIFYLVWWERDNRINIEFNQKLTREMIERKCESCNKMEAMLRLENEKEVCLIPVNCEDPNNQIIKLDTSKSPIINFIRSTPIFASSINLQDFAHNKESIKQEFPSDATVDIVIEATSDVTPVGVFVRECRIRSGLKSVVILVNGCSISNLLDNFRIMRWSTNKKFVLSAKFIPFSIEDPSRNHTLGCIIMLCEGICNVQSSCQNHLRESNIEHSRVVTDVYIQTTYKVLESKKTQELSKLPSANQSSGDVKKIENIECADISSSITMKICYMYLVFLSLLFLFLISVLFICLRQQERRRNKIEDEVESPQRIIYQEECKTRRRSPNNSLVKY